MFWRNVGRRKQQSRQQGSRQAPFAFFCHAGTQTRALHEVKTSGARGSPASGAKPCRPAAAHAASLARLPQACCCLSAPLTSSLLSGSLCLHEASAPQTCRPCEGASACPRSTQSGRCRMHGRRAAERAQRTFRKWMVVLNNTGGEGEGEREARRGRGGWPGREGRVHAALVAELSCSHAGQAIASRRWAASCCSAQVNTAGTPAGNKENGLGQRM